MKFSNKHYIYLIAIFFIIIYFVFIKNNSYNNFKIIYYKNITVFTTQNWFSYQPADSKYDFKISIPHDWSMKETIFYLDNQKKAELSPGIVKLNKNQKCFDAEWFNETGESELISMSEIKINKLDGKLLIEKTIVSDGKNNNEYLYPHFYCLSNNSFAFTIAFYEKDINNVNVDLHYSILKSIKF